MGGHPGHDTSGQGLDVTQARLLDSSAIEDGKGALALRGRDSQIDRDLALIERNLREEGLENKTSGQDGQDRGPAGTGAKGARKKAKKKKKARAGAKSALQGNGTSGSGNLNLPDADGPPAQSRSALGADGAYGADGFPVPGKRSDAGSSEAAQANLGV